MMQTILLIISAVIIVIFIARTFEIDCGDVTYLFYKKLRDKINNPKHQKNFYKRIHCLKKLLRRKSAREWLTFEVQSHYDRCSRYKREGRALTLSESNDDDAKSAVVWALTAHRHLFTKKELKIIDKCCKDIAERVPNWSEFFPSTPAAQRAAN